MVPVNLLYGVPFPDQLTRISGYIPAEKTAPACRGQRWTVRAFLSGGWPEEERGSIINADEVANSAGFFSKCRVGRLLLGKEADRHEQKQI